MVLDYDAAVDMAETILATSYRRAWALARARFKKMTPINVKLLGKSKTKGKKRYQVTFKARQRRR